MGASTGRDGIGGASVLASAELEGGDDSKRPTVQIGDPFEEAKLLECCLELLGEGLLVSLQDLGAAGLTSSAGEMAVERRSRDRHRRRPGAAARGRHGAVRDHGLGVAGADAGGGRAGQGRRGDRPLREVGDGVGRGRRGDRVGGISGCCATARWSARCRSRRWSTSAPSTTSSRPSPTAGCTGTAPRSRPRTAARPCSSSWPRRASPASDGRSSSTTRSCSRTPCAGPRHADAAVLHLPEAGATIAVSIDGNGRRVACDPYAGTVEAVLECAQNLACAGADAARAHQLPQLRQPGEAGRRLAARPLDPGARRCVRGARRPGRRRQRLALQRDRPGPDLPDPGRRHGRRARRSRARRRPGARGGRRDRGLRALLALARRLGAGEAARRARSRAPVAADRRGRGRDRGGP